MTPDLRDYARLLLRHEPTHSLPLGVLHERLRQVAGPGWTGTRQLEHALGADAAFRVLRPPPLIQVAVSGFAPEQLAAGFPQPEPRVLLVETGPQTEAAPGPFGYTGDSLLALLGRAGAPPDLAEAVAEAVAALEEIGHRLAEAVPEAGPDQPVPVSGEPAAARSTTRPPDPPPRPSGRRRRPRSASSPPPRPGSRSG